MIDLTGVSLKLTDKRIIPVLQKNGYAIDAIYCSPIQSWLLLFSLLLSAMSPILISIFAVSLWAVLAGLLIYFVMVYLYNNRYYNSFAIQPDRSIVVVNLNWPLRRVKRIHAESVIQIRVASVKEKWWYIMLCHFRGNYIEITFNNKETERIYCSGLLLDAFDENWTERTFDDFYCHLIRLSYKVEVDGSVAL